MSNIGEKSFLLVKYFLPKLFERKKPMQFKTHFYIYYEFLLAYTLLNQAKYY